MNVWSEQPIEEQRLLNPIFCAMVLWHASQGHVAGSWQHSGIAFEECFLVLPIVLHRETRESLPVRTTTSLSVWIGDHPLIPTTIADRARSLVPFTKEAMRFAGLYGLLKFNHTIVLANLEWRRRITAALVDSSDEVRSCANRAKFVGKWFGKTGNPETVMSLLGVQP